MIYVKISLISQIFSCFLVFRYDFSIYIDFTQIFKHSKWWRHKLGHM